jgi:hypothetical protein
MSWKRQGSQWVGQLWQFIDKEHYIYRIKAIFRRPVAQKTQLCHRLEGLQDGVSSVRTATQRNAAIPRLFLYVRIIDPDARVSVIGGAFNGRFRVESGNFRLNKVVIWWMSV